MTNIVKHVLLLCLLAAALAAAGTEPAPVVRERCTDLTGTLTPDQLRALNEKLLRFEQETSNQVVVLMVPTTGEEVIEDFTLRVAEANKLGRKGRDNGVLLLVAKDDRAMRIEVGYGLEGALPDAISNQIIRRVIAPSFRDGDYYAGLDAGVDGIIAATKGEFQGDGRGGNSGKRSVPLILVILIMIIASVIGSGFRRRRHYIGSGGYWGGFGGGGFGGGGFGGGGFGGGGGFSGGGGGFGGGGSSGSW